MLRRVLPLAFCAAALAAIAPPASPPLANLFDRVEIAPTKTSIYVGSVSMTMPPFARKNGRYESTYTAKVFPYFFSSEAGSLTVEISDEQLAKLARGDAIDFTGRALRTDGAERRIAGKATPADAKSGKIKVRVSVSKRVELIFNTTYRFAAPD
jgi:hypothetical protein